MTFSNDPSVLWKTKRWVTFLKINTWINSSEHGNMVSFNTWINDKV